MRSLESYLTEYSESHQNVLNIKIHNVCVPAIFWSLLGFLSSFTIYNQLNAAHLLTAASLAFYVSFKNLRLIATMVLIVIICFISFELIPAVRATSIIVFVSAWIGQFYGHKIEGKKPSFFKDLLFLLIGPVWVLKKLAPKSIGA